MSRQTFGVLRRSGEHTEYIPSFAVANYRRAMRKLYGLAFPRRLLSMRIGIEWGILPLHWGGGWSLRLPAGNAVRHKSGHPFYFKTPKEALAWADKNMRCIREQLMNPYWGWREGSYVRQPWMERAAKRAACGRAA